MAETHRFEENIEGAWSELDGMYFDLSVYTPERGGFRVLQKSSFTKKASDASCPAAKPCGFVLSFRRAPEPIGSIVVRTYSAHAREVTQEPGGNYGRVFRQIDEPGALRDSRGRLVFPARIIEARQSEPFACMNIATQLAMMEMLSKARKGVQA